MAYVDDFGMTITYGLGEGQELKNRTDTTDGVVHTIVTDIDYDRFGLPSANAVEGFGRGIAKIPANSIIDDVVLYVTTAPATPGSTINVGISKKDGTVIDEDGLLAGTSLEAGAHYGESEALIELPIGADDGYITVTTAAGAEALKGLKAKLVIKFV